MIEWHRLQFKLHYIESCRFDSPRYTILTFPWTFIGTHFFCWIQLLCSLKMMYIVQWLLKEFGYLQFYIPPSKRQSLYVLLQLSILLYAANYCQTMSGYTLTLIYDQWSLGPILSDSAAYPSLKSEVSITHICSYVHPVTQQYKSTTVQNVPL